MDNNEKLREALGDLSDKYIDEALDYRPEKGCIRRKRTGAIILAAAMIMAIAIIPVGAIGVMKTHRLGVFSPENAVDLYDDSVTVTVENPQDNVVCFSVTCKNGEYTDPYIYAYELEGYYGAASTPYDDNYGKLSGNFSTSGGGGLKLKDYVKDYKLYLEKETYGGRMRPERDYKLIVEGVAAKTPDGEVVELQGAWEVEFRF